MASLGRHIIVEYYDCDPQLMNDVVHIEESMQHAAETAGATIINSTFHHFSPYGVSGVVVIQESHLAIHTWPEYGYASVDLFTCGGEVDPWVAYRELKSLFKAGHGSAVELSRGEMALLHEKEFDVKDLRDHKSHKDGTPVRTRDVWFTERDDRIALSLKHDGKLFSEKSDFQKVDVYDTRAYGKMLTLDGMVMTTEKDEYVYHEMITHVPMLTHPNPKRALIIGGGDGGTARELLRHENLDEVVMVEIDQVVIDACKEHLPEIAVALDHERLTLLVEDGLKYVAEAADESFDLVIVDSTDPVGPAEGLFSKTFYEGVHRILKKDGVMVTQSESPRFNQKVFKEIYQVYGEIFGAGQVHCYLAYIPTYPTGMWSFSYSSKGETDPIKHFNDSASEQFSKKHGLKYYNEAIHQAAFALPGFVKEMLNE
ncbi:MAG: polyamine aminopropyltransferase [Roseivirga sp.]|nr:polyamine aminopropyltransferase [Roseivirga sp.]